MRDDNANDLRQSLNHAAPEDDASIATEFAPEEAALTRLAEAWRATTPSAERLAAFTRDLPTRTPVAPATSRPAALRERASQPKPSGQASQNTRYTGQRLLGGLAAAVIIVGLLSAALLRLAPGRSGQRPQIPTASATATPLRARAIEEPSSGAATGAWATVAHTLLIPAPSDGNVVYREDGGAAHVSHDGGATWSALTLPTFTQPNVSVADVSLRVSDTSPDVVLLGLTLNVPSYNPADWPAGCFLPTGPAQNGQTGLHGGILASGQPYCLINYASHDGGATWARMSLPANIFRLPSALDPARVWQLGDTLFGLNSILFGLQKFTGAQLIVSHDLGVTWTYDSAAPMATQQLCNVLPSASEGALYAVTTSGNCFGSASSQTFTVWRSVDAAVTWQSVSTVSAGEMLLIAATPAANHGVWLYALTYAPGAFQPATIIVSADGGGVWSQAPETPHTPNTIPVVWPLHGTLSDGSAVVADWTPAATRAGSVDGLTTVRLLAWRPGDSQWRALTTRLPLSQGLPGGELPVAVTRGGPNTAQDTIWATNTQPQGPNVAITVYRASIT